MLKIHYYRYDQDYSGWDLWVWEKGKEGSVHMFHYEEVIHYDVPKIAMVADIDVSNFTGNELGFIVRRGGWHERDLSVDRYYTFSNQAIIENEDIYVVQDSPEIYTSLDGISLLPGFQQAIFENFREIYVRLQAPCRESHEKEPFKVFENGLEIPLRHVTPTRGSREFLISLTEDMVPGNSYTVYKPGFQLGSVAYGMIYDTPEFERLFTYDGNDLGAVWSPGSTTFKVWSPLASAVFLNLYETGIGPSLKDVYEMMRGEKGVWEIQIPGNLSGVYYTYSVIIMGKTYEAADPYARASGVNGIRSMVLDMKLTDPDGWERVYHKEISSPTDAILYEIHVRDITIHSSSGVINRGRYLGLAEKDTRSFENIPTGLSHLKELGITHVHLMPVFDFQSVDETQPLESSYNWGYDPGQYNVPEGSYSSDPSNGITRIKELKQMIMALKETGIGVIMDVVYNHTYKTADSNFNKLMPGYYYRAARNGQFSNGSGCGNETASERSMVRHFILDSVKFWATEYKIDGFRFDLMGLHDIETMNEVRMELDRISPSILLYGEGWTGGPSLLNSSDAALKINASRVNRIGFFNDNTRDAIKGSAFHAYDQGFIQGNVSMKESVKFGVAGAICHPGVDFTRVNYSGFAWASYAWHCINYAASHDNLTLYDKLLKSAPDLSEYDYIRMVKLAAAIVLTSQGIPFLMLGTDFMRSKKGEHNSYNSPDEINQIDWSLKYRYNDVFNYHKGLILLRKAHPAFRMVLAEEIRKNLVFYPSLEWVISFSLNNHANNDPWRTIFVAFNAGYGPETFPLPEEGEWHIVVDENTAGTKSLGSFCDKKVTVPPRSAMVLYISD